ncbi:MAG: hypothetical protein GY790_09965, partial [Bacteroidetes bacterium]|nr:hypothetical protein [Bacteroidota bacterium]
MNSLVLVLLAIVGYLAAYQLYGRYLGKKVMGLAADRIMPAHELNDGIDFVPTKR